jgi:hypothetical protein
LPSGCASIRPRRSVRRIFPERSRLWSGSRSALKSSTHFWPTMTARLQPKQWLDGQSTIWFALALLQECPGPWTRHGARKPPGALSAARRVRRSLASSGIRTRRKC